MVIEAASIGWKGRILLMIGIYEHGCSDLCASHELCGRLRQAMYSFLVAATRSGRRYSSPCYLVASEDGSRRQRSVSRGVGGTMKSSRRRSDTLESGRN